MNLALFDFDGTITVGDTFVPFVRFAMRPRRMPIAVARFLPMGIGYQLGWVSAAQARPVIARLVFEGEDAAAVDELGLTYARNVLPGVVRRQALERIEWHIGQGDRVVVVSGSLETYLSHWCRSLGVELICTQLEESYGALTGRYVGRDCIGAEKVRRIRERYDLASFPLVYAYGDTEDDLDMLGLAQRKYFRWKEVRS
jgi:phosphatidylglycerophosphatase C